MAETTDIHGWFFRRDCVVLVSPVASGPVCCIRRLLSAILFVSVFNSEQLQCRTLHDSATLLRPEKLWPTFLLCCFSCGSEQFRTRAIVRPNFFLRCFCYR
uniref:Uncharacterized protein n=1 Tax=Grammatophora oceanica TaxID=210454 RepID=A0A7S1V416_9STRA